MGRHLRGGVGEGTNPAQEAAAVSPPCYEVVLCPRARVPSQVWGIPAGLTRVMIPAVPAAGRAAEALRPSAPGDAGAGAGPGAGARLAGPAPSLLPAVGGKEGRGCSGTAALYGGSSAGTSSCSSLNPRGWRFNRCCSSLARELRDAVSALGPADSSGSKSLRAAELHTGQNTPCLAPGGQAGAGG